MPVSDLDIWRSANLLIKQHGAKAWTEAVLKYFEMKRAGDADGVKVWRRIARAISFFTSPLPASDPNPSSSTSSGDYDIPARPEHFLN